MRNFKHSLAAILAVVIISSLAAVQVTETSAVIVSPVSVAEGAAIV